MHGEQHQGTGISLGWTDRARLREPTNTRYVEVKVKRNNSILNANTGTVPKCSRHKVFTLSRLCRRRVYYGVRAPDEKEIETWRGTRMAGRRLVVDFLLCIIALHAPGIALAQSVKSTYEKDRDLKKYKKYAWGSNYLLTRQHPQDEARINLELLKLHQQGFGVELFRMDQAELSPSSTKQASQISMPEHSVIEMERTRSAPPGRSSVESSSTFGFNSLCEMRTTPIIDAARKSRLEWSCPQRIYDANKSMDKLEEMLINTFKKR